MTRESRDVNRYPKYAPEVERMMRILQLSFVFANSPMVMFDGYNTIMIAASAWAKDRGYVSTNFSGSGNDVYIEIFPTELGLTVLRGLGP